MNDWNEKKRQGQAFIEKEKHAGKSDGEIIASLQSELGVSEVLALVWLDTWIRRHEPRRAGMCECGRRLGVANDCPRCDDPFYGAGKDE